MNIARCLSLLLLPVAAYAAQPRSISLTIQDNGNAQISETQDLVPPGADGLLRVAPLPETLWPASVTAIPADSREPFTVLSQHFTYDLLDNASLFLAHRGESITCRKGTDVFTGRLASLPDFSSSSPSVVLETEGQATRMIPNILNLDSIEFPNHPSLAHTPTLVWRIPGNQAVPGSLQLHYAAAGLSWKAFHEAILADDSRSIALSSRIHLKNSTTRTFSNARIRLALTEKGQFPPLVPNPADLRASKSVALRFSADGKSWVPERSSATASIVATYDIPSTQTLSANSDTLVVLATSPSLAVETRYLYDGVRFDRYQRNRRTDWNLGTEFSTAVETTLAFSSPKDTPLPPGEFRLLKGLADQALEWIGTAWIPALKAGESTSLQLGPATGLSARRLRTGFSEVVPLKVSEESFEITLDNQTPADKTITVVEHLYRGEKHEITTASSTQSPVEGDPNAIQFTVPVKASTQKSLTYTVRYTW